MKKTMRGSKAPVTADGVRIRAGMALWSARTKDGGKSWYPVGKVVQAVDGWGVEWLGDKGYIEMTTETFQFYDLNACMRACKSKDFKRKASK